MAVEPAPVEELDPRSVNRLRGKVCVVTGAGQGIGRWVSRRMAAEGARVVIWDRSEEGAARTVTELREHGAAVASFIGDLSDFASVERLVGETLRAEGHIDVLANIVGGATHFKPFVDWDVEEMLTELNR